MGSDHRASGSGGVGQWRRRRVSSGDASTASKRVELAKFVKFVTDGNRLKCVPMSDVVRVLDGTLTA